ncbi:MAG: tetratricopeptide repeat protein, partial [Anaerolineae bacterium]
ATANPSSPEAMFQLGNSHYQAGEWDKAIAAYRQAIELNPNYDAAYANLGAVYYAQQKLDLAEETYLKAISLAPNDADVIYNLGAIYLQQAVSTGIQDQTKLAQAVAKINKAIELNPDLAEPYYGLGVANQLLGENDAAIEAFETFLKLDDGSDPIATSKATEILQKLKSGQGQ